MRRDMEMAYFLGAVSGVVIAFVVAALLVTWSGL